MGVGGQHHAPAALPPIKTQYPLYRRLGGSQGQCVQVRKMSPPTGIRLPDRSARSESQYRLSSRGPLYIIRRYESLGFSACLRHITAIRFCTVSVCFSAALSFSSLQHAVHCCTIGMPVCRLPGAACTTSTNYVTHDGFLLIWKQRPTLCVQCRV